jgi:hypothetical protein
MQEFMLLVFNEGDCKSSMSESEHLAFVKQCEIYIKDLKSRNQLIAAQPLVREGTLISRQDGAWKENVVDATKKIQVGYYHILAKDFEDATAIAKRNPEFEYCSTATIEVRPIKTKEKSTGFNYPKQG